MSDAEIESKSPVTESNLERSLQGPILDPHGFPLRPQPSQDPLDPLNWNPWWKLWVLFQVSLLAFLGPFEQGLINAAFRPLAKAMHISVVEASYSTTIAIVLAGVCPLIWSPISNVYGRRPILVFVTAIGIAADCAAAVAQTWSGHLAARAFVGFGTSAGMGIGAATVADLYFMHERGRYMGIYVVFLGNGAHVATLVGGFIAQSLGWRWCFWTAAIILAIVWLVILFALPETLYHRNNATGETIQPSFTTSYLSLFTFRKAISSSKVSGGRSLYIADFSHVPSMLRYPSVVLPLLYYSISNGISTVLYNVTGANALGRIYHYGPSDIGLTIGLSTTLGTLIGELLAGRVSDWFLFLYTRRHGGDQQPEARLQAIWPGVILCPLGTIIEGICLKYHTPWIGPAMGVAIGCFGLQIISTNVYAYVTDCYKPQSAEISTLLNFGRQTFAFTLGFYMIPFAHRTNYAVAWSVMALCSVASFSGIIVLMLKGRQWREKLGVPGFHRDL